MKKLIKLSEDHYIIVDDSEIKEDDWVTNGVECFLRESMSEYSDEYANRYWQKITHSTQPLEIIKIPSEVANIQKISWGGIKVLSLSEVEEAIYGYSVEKMAQSAFTHPDFGKYKIGSVAYYNGYKDGFKAHQELVKDKLFTLKDVINIIEEAQTTDESMNYPSIEEILKGFMPKTEWDIEIDEQGKIKLI